MLQSGPRGNPPPPPRPSGISALPHLIAHAIAPVEHVAQVVQHSAPAQHYIATHSPPPPLSQARLTHVAGRTAPVASFEAHSLSQPAYLQAVAQVFRSQSPQIQARVISGITARNAFDTPEYHAIRTQWDHLPLQSRSMISSLIPKDLPSFISPKNGPDIFGTIGHILNPANVYGADRKGSTQGGGSLAGVALFGGQKGAETLLKNSGKDIVGLPGEAISTVGTIGGDVVGGHVGKAVSDFINPYVQLVKHPAGSFYQHPVLSTLMATGALHGATRLAAAPIRALAPESTAGRLLSTQREGIALTGKLTHERAAYSTSPSVKAGQVAAEGLNYVRAPTGELVPRSDFLRKRLINQGVGQLVGVAERIRRVNQEQVKAAREKAITSQSRVARTAMKAAHGAKTALAYGPKGAAIPGADVLARIADATIRRPDTVAQDIRTHLTQVSANRPNLLDDSQALKTHDAYVKQLQKALSNKAFLKNPDRAFEAAQAYAKDYAPVEAKAAAFGHFREMGADALQRRSLMHYAITHIPGVRFNDTLGVIRDAGKPEVRALRSQLIAQADTLESRGAVREAAALRDRAKEVWNEQAVPISNAEILNHLKGPQGTGGRLPAYTPDRVTFGRKGGSFYVSSERRPLPTNARNTLYAYTHGLTDPGHESLLEQHALMQGVIDSHHAQNTYLDTLTTQKPGGGYWSDYRSAKRDAPPGYRPINVSQPFHPQESLDQAMQGVDPATIEEEAQRRSLDLSSRLQPGTSGRWAIIDDQAVKALGQFQNQISPNPLLRTIRGLNTQFRTVALATSAKHIPGVLQENLIRDIASGVGFRSWISGRRMIKGAERTEGGQALRTQLTGGQVAGMTEAGRTYRVSDHWAGTNAYPFLKAFEAAAKAPGLRQMRTLWRGWTRLAIQGTKKVLEEQHQIAGLGKAALREHGYAEAARTQGFVGLVQRAFGLHGQMLEDATKSLFDPAKARQMRATINQLYGKWTDLSPSAQTALMFSPFGLWWANSARFLARMPVDMPVKTGLLASATAGTQQERQAHGLDMFAPGALPLFEQGGIPSGGKILAQNYYSPFGVANDPLETGQSLIQPWLTPFVTGSLGVDFLGKPLTSPGQNTNRGNEKAPNVGQRAQYIIDSALASFVPLYTKAAQIAEGGASAYDVSPGGVLPPLVRGKAPATKTPGQGPAAGAEKAFRPFRSYKAVGGAGSSPAKSWNFSGGGSPTPAPSSSGGGGWNFSGGGSSGSSGSGGWNFGGS